MKNVVVFPDPLGFNSKKSLRQLTEWKASGVRKGMSIWIVANNDRHPSESPLIGETIPHCHPSAEGGTLLNKHQLLQEDNGFYVDTSWVMPRDSSFTMFRNR